MAKKPDFDLQAAHKYFSVECFNRAWDYIDKPARNSNEGDVMLRLSMASLWHWTQREDCTPTNLSIGYWQVSRVYALLRNAEQAKYYGQLCLEAANNETVEPQYRGWAFEALARAELVADNEEGMEKYLIQAHQIASSIPNAVERKMLLKDLASIR